jgi:deoxyribodipyrimidine photo-lyase
VRNARRRVRSLDLRAAGLEAWAIDRSVSPVNTFRGGHREGAWRLRRFVRERLRGYARQRNRPELDGTSQLSPYLHFGHLGPLEVALAVEGAEAPEEDRAQFLEELIIRRELAVNFVRYNPSYDRLDGCERWALATLRDHARDRRRPVPLQRLVDAESPDPLWNAAQAQMLETGWMHGYMRMYWAKRLLEWTASPEEAFALAVALNDTYELDGNDPNGYAGVAWAIGGKHDRAFAERPAFGKVRYMSPTSTARKFDARAYVARFTRRAAADFSEPRPNMGAP